MGLRQLLLLNVIETKFNLTRLTMTKDLSKTRKPEGAELSKFAASTSAK
jgi:hypothetical protein